MRALPRAAALHRAGTQPAHAGRDGRRLVPGRPLADAHVPHRAARRVVDAPERRLLPRRPLRHARGGRRALQPQLPARAERPGKNRADRVPEIHLIHPPTGEPMKLSSIAVALATSLSLASAFAQTGPTYPQIAGIVVTANQIDIDAGELAKSHTKNKEGSKFAQQMITGHTAVNMQAPALAEKLDLTPADSDTSKSLKSGAQKNIANLKGLKGAAFDKAYVDHEVEYHQAVLDAIDKVLIPSAKNAELKD